jgi:hypothetical protein
MFWISWLLGAIIVVDGIGSIILYRKQTLPEHLVRVIRIVVGLIVICLA